MRKLGTDLLRAVYQGDTGLLDAEVSAGTDGIPDHLDALLQRGPRDDGSIGEKQQLVVSRYLHHGQMSQHLALRQQAVLLVEDGTEQVVGVDDALHQNVGTTLTHDAHRLAGRLIGVLDVNGTDIVGILLQRRIFLKDRRIANHQKLSNALFQGPCNGILGIGIVGADHSNAFPAVQCLQVFRQLVKVAYRFHTVRFLANIRKNVEKSSIRHSIFTSV